MPPQTGGLGVGMWYVWRGLFKSFIVKTSEIVAQNIEIAAVNCSYDSRTGDPGNKGLWSEPAAFGERAYFRVGESPAVLSIKNLTKEDGGVYTCRWEAACLTENEGI